MEIISNDVSIINQKFVDKYIDKIYVTPNGNSMNLEIKIFTGDVIDKKLDNLRVRSGNIFLKMCPERKTKVFRVDRNTNNHEKIYTYFSSIVI